MEITSDHGAFWAQTKNKKKIKKKKKPQPNKKNHKSTNSQTSTKITSYKSLVLQADSLLRQLINIRTSPTPTSPRMKHGGNNLKFLTSALQGDFNLSSGCDPPLRTRVHDTEFNAKKEA
jgi:hypothetical protein